MSYEFVREHDGSLDLRSAVFQALGSASMCWDEIPTGVFDSEQASEVGEALLAFIASQDGPKLGMATTRQLLAEVATRIQVDYYAGGGGLEYSTVAGRPESTLS